MRHGWLEPFCITLVIQRVSPLEEIDREILQTDIERLRDPPMRYPPDQKEKTRRRILEAAGRTFRINGYSATGVDAVMEEAGLTAGAFYGHFGSKDELLHATIENSFENARHLREQNLDGLHGLDWVFGLIDNYLSTAHFENVEVGCPLPALTAELGRGDSELRRSFERQVTQWATELEATLTEAMRSATGPERSRSSLRELALGVISTLVGAMTLARAMPSAVQAHRVLDGARRTAKSAVERELRVFAGGPN